MSENQSSYLIFLSISLVLLSFSLFVIIKALRTGKISYKGNRLNMPIMTYTRKESPFGFWAGIVVFSFVGIVGIVLAIVMSLSYLFGINI